MDYIHISFFLCVKFSYSNSFKHRAHAITISSIKLLSKSPVFAFYGLTDDFQIFVSNRVAINGSIVLRSHDTVARACVIRNH